MKSPKLVAFLLLVNLGLFAGILGYVFQVRLGAPIPAPQAHPPVANRESPVAVTPPPLPESGSNQFRWAQLESEDYRTYVARLRSIGCPEQTVRDIIIADLDKLLAPELRATHGRREHLKYWHPEEEEMLNDVDPNQVYRRERELDKRKQEILRELVNADLARERMKATGQDDYYERRLSFLPEDRRTQVRELLERFDEAERLVQEKETSEAGGLSGADREQLKTLRQQRETELSAALSPSEHQLYELWLSPVANEVRHATYGMEATEQEFLTIFNARKAYEDTWGQHEGELLDPATEQQMAEARTQRDAQILAGLGPERFAAYQRGQDHDYHLLSALVTRFNLPKDKATEVYDYKMVTASYRAQVASDATLTPQQKEEARRAISEETRQTVRGVLGPKAYQHYVRTGQGHWMDPE